MGVSVALRMTCPPSNVLFSKVVEYVGPPKKRESMPLGGEFILMSMSIFKKDWDRLWWLFSDKPVHIILDEATAIKNTGSQNYKSFRNFIDADNKTIQLLTGTPLNSPIDAYAYIKLVAPTVYRNLHQFENIHVEERDFFNNATKWCNLELLHDNLLVNADRKLKEDVLTELPPCVVSPIFYDLAPAHSRLYRTLAEEQLLRLPDNSKIDAATATALWHSLQQIVLQWAHYSQDSTKVAAGYEVLDEVLEEIAPSKLVVFANYRRSNTEIVARYGQSHGAVGVWGDLSPTEKANALTRFLNDPTCRLITLNPQSAGLGIDDLQQVSADVLFLEFPLTPALYNQCLSRVYRDGQRKSVNVRVAVALG